MTEAPDMPDEVWLSENGDPHGVYYAHSDVLRFDKRHKIKYIRADLPAAPVAVDGLEEALVNAPDTANMWCDRDGLTEPKDEEHYKAILKAARAYLAATKGA